MTVKKTVSKGVKNHGVFEWNVESTTKTKEGWTPQSGVAFIHSAALQPETSLVNMPTTERMRT